MSEIAVPCVIYGAKSSEDRHGSIGTQLEDSRQKRPSAQPPRAGSRANPTKADGLAGLRFLDGVV